MEIVPAIEGAFVKICEKTGKTCFPLSDITRELEKRLAKEGFKPRSVRRILYDMRKDGNNVFFENKDGDICLWKHNSVEDYFEKPKKAPTQVTVETVITTITTTVTMPL